MDFNGIAFGVSAEAGYPLSQVPLGFGMNMMENEAALEGPAGMTESEKERLRVGGIDPLSQNKEVVHHERERQQHL